ncbi:ribose-5-phosphate isomerase RpiA [Corallococcus sp. 4LFB]|uniref:ribose-5-phosphate isomerase RpiA n=1 Tax=Corallococcus sp. 4LFB TaxID=3383249 RepID=UPI003976ACFB
MRKLDEHFGVLSHPQDALGMEPGVLARPLITVLSSTVELMGAGITVLALAVFGLLFGQDLYASILGWVRPRSRARVRRVVGRMREAVGNYLVGTLLIVSVGGAFTAFMSLALGVPYFLPLGLVAMVLGLIPYIGSVITALLVTVTTLASVGSKRALIALVVFMVYQQIESHLLSPLVQRRAIKMNPLLISLVALVGGTVAGLLGVILAVPAAAAGRCCSRRCSASGARRGSASGASRRPCLPAWGTWTRHCWRVHLLRREMKRGVRRLWTPGILGRRTEQASFPEHPMTSEESVSASFKRAAAERAVDFIQSGMVVGLGTGSTAAYAVRRLGALLSAGTLKDVVGVPTSRATEALAVSLGVPLTTLDVHPVVDLTIDGADEVAPDLSLIKGGGGALLREKVVAQASRREIIVVDAPKLSPRLGTKWPVPVEVLPFGWRSQALFLESLGARVVPRLALDGAPYHTDQGNVVLDCDFGPIGDPAALAAKLESRAGVMAHGLFLNLATDLVVAGPEGITHRVRGA